MSHKKRNLPKRLMIIPIDVVYRYIDEHPGDLRMDYGGYNFSLRRTVVHKEIGLICVHCGLEGYHYALEDCHGGLHLDLYSILPDGSERLMTIDHILPKSKGGPNELSNYQMLCTVCNRNKGNKIEELVNQEMEVLICI